ncbi:LuxR C-terminal-related transcriptional regulator [Cryomorphaceae bacterium 1068]|nr:LuxR C-terminal-related transcriptional regulator [Cryomorphaceae bacterium 1068]
MEKLKFNLSRNEWMVLQSDQSIYPEKIKEHQAWLERFQTGDFFYLIVLSESTRATVCSEGVTKVLGYDAQDIHFDFLLDLIHPDDVAVMEEFEAEAERFYLSIPEEERWNYKTQYNLRLKSKTGKFKQLMFQSQPLRLTDTQQVEYLYVFTDISSIKTNSDQYLSLINLRGGESKKLYRQKKKIEKLPDFTMRELEILEAAMREKDLPFTAQKLHISLETLNNHLKRIRRKAGAKSTVHLLAMTNENKWLKKE